MIYIDPGNGLFLLQAAASVVLGGIFMARSKIGELRTRIARKLKRTPDETPEEPPEADSE